MECLYFRTEEEDSKMGLVMVILSLIFMSGNVMQDSKYGEPQLTAEPYDRLSMPGCVVQSVARLTQEPEVLG